MMLQSGAGLASMGRGETLLHAMPERLIRTTPWRMDEEATATRIFETIGSCVAKEALSAMAQTMEQHGLLPLHSCILHFNQAITSLRSQREQKEQALEGGCEPFEAKERRALERQQEEAMKTPFSTTVSQLRRSTYLPITTSIPRTC